jgi:tetratricopeptide (TPR) repeat protein
MNCRILLMYILLFGMAASAARAEVHYSLLDLATMYGAQGNETKALDMYAQAIAREPANIKGYEARAFYLLKLNRTAEALADFSAMIAISPAYAAAYVSRGLVYSQLDNKPRAEADFAAACALGDSSGCSFVSGK